MELFLYILFLCLGVLLLCKAGGWSVTNAIHFAMIYKIESFIVGFFIFALATGLPEMASAIVSSIEKVPELSAGNLVGSTFVNLSLQLGIASILAKKLIVEPSLRNRIIQTLAVVTLVVVILLFFVKGNLYLGSFLCFLYVLSFFWRPKTPKKHFSEEIKKEESDKKVYFSPKVDVTIKLLLSLFLLVVSAWVTVLSAVHIAKITQISAALIGGSIIAVGTALPELSLEIHAVRRKEYGLAIGDIFGSSLLNISLILGLLTLLNPSFTFTIPALVFPFFLANVAWIFYRLIRSQPFLIWDGIYFIFLFSLYIGRILFF